MNVYDFDKTIYPKDSTLEFYMVSLLKHPSFLLDLPRALFSYVRYFFGRITKKELRESFLRSFGRIRDLEGESERFWAKRKHRVYDYYKQIRHPDDVVISASPELFLRPIARELGFGTLIASRFDPKVGKYDGERCWGEGKPPRFYELFPEGHIDAFYSDSLSDTPMARIAERAYLIKKGKPTDWPKFD